MMTFILVADLIRNAQLLDNARLGKQRIEARQILDAIQSGTGWKHHPATRAWASFVPALKYYTNCIIAEWERRGFANTQAYFELPKFILWPWWLSWDRLHQSHRAMLLRKQPQYYTAIFQEQLAVDPEYMLYGYIWPSKVDYKQKDLPLAEITDPIPEYLASARYCPAVIISGKRKGQVCGQVLKSDKFDLCGIHRR
jgi:hypothetical protein